MDLTYDQMINEFKGLDSAQARGVTIQNALGVAGLIGRRLDDYSAYLEQETLEEHLSEHRYSGPGKRLGASQFYAKAIGEFCDVSIWSYYEAGARSLRMFGAYADVLAAAGLLTTVREALRTETKKSTRTVKAEIEVRTIATLREGLKTLKAERRAEFIQPRLARIVAARKATHPRSVLAA